MKHLARRAELLASARAFFAGRGYLEVETPVLVPSPGLDVHLDAFETNGPPALRYLSTSPEYQMKRLLAQGHGRIMQVARAFRREEKGARHNPEFTMLEFYRAHASMDAIVLDTEQLIARLTGGEVRLRERAGKRERTVDVRPPFFRLSVAEAFERYAGLSADAMLRLAAEDETRFYELLAFTVEPRLAELDRAVVLHRYPTRFASLARACPDDARFAERFEIYVAGVELCNGFGELTAAAEQRARFLADQAERRARNLPVYPIDERFLRALEGGLPDCAGNAVGFDRLAALACGTTEIADLLAFTADEL
jgi:lysyl-tRNA synthetase class 2